MDLQPVELDLSDPAKPVLRVGGEDLTTHVDRAVLIYEPGALPRVVLEYATPAQAEALATVESVDTSGLPAIREWLASLDPGELERVALEQFGTFADETEIETPGQAWIAALQKLAP